MEMHKYMIVLLSILTCPIMLWGQPIRVVNNSSSRVFLLVTRENDIPEIISLTSEPAEKETTLTDVKTITINNKDTFSFSPKNLKNLIGQKITDDHEVVDITQDDGDGLMTIYYAKQSPPTLTTPTTAAEEVESDLHIQEARQKHRVIEKEYTKLQRDIASIHHHLNSINHNIDQLAQALNTQPNTQPLINLYDTTLDQMIKLKEYADDLAQRARNVEQLKEDLESIYEVFQDKHMSQSTRQQLHDTATYARQTFQKIVTDMNALYEDMVPLIKNFESIENEFNAYLDEQSTWWQKLKRSTADAFETIKKGWRISSQQAQEYTQKAREYAQTWYSSDEEEETSPKSGSPSPEPIVKKLEDIALDDLVDSDYSPGEESDDIE